MPYPQEDRLKLLIERVADLERQRHAPKTYEDVVFHGVITGIKTLEPSEPVEGDTTGDDSDCPHRYIEVAPYGPIASSAGHLEFDADEHPLIEINDSTRRDKVFVLNVPSHLIDLYFPVGEIISYWRYSGVGDLTELVRGSFVTRKEDLSFWSKVEWECYCPEDTDGCSPSIPTFPKSAFQYKFTAYLPDPSADKLQEKWKEFYPCGASDEDGTPYTGICFNLEELFNGMDNKTGTGIKVSSSGQRLDIAEPSFIQPVGPLICKVTPFVDPDTERCDYKEFYFGPITNQFAPKQASAGCKYCVYAFTAKLLCGETSSWDMSYGGNSHGAEGISYDGKECRVAPEKVGQWVKLNHNEDGNYCKYQFYVLGACCIGGEDTPCDDPADDLIPTLPDPVPDDCCTIKCQFHLQVTYDCSLEPDSRWGNITVVDADTICDVATGDEGKWDEGTKSGTVTTFNYYYVGDPCEDADSCDISPGDYPELPAEPPGPQLPCCPGEEGKNYVLACIGGVIQWVETGAC